MFLAVVRPGSPHGETGTGPPIQTFGGDALGINSQYCLILPRLLLNDFRSESIRFQRLELVERFERVELFMQQPALSTC
jgi:hypothetical protein